MVKKKTLALVGGCALLAAGPALMTGYFTGAHKFFTRGTAPGLKDYAHLRNTADSPMQDYEMYSTGIQSEDGQVLWSFLQTPTISSSSLQSAKQRSPAPVQNFAFFSFLTQGMEVHTIPKGLDSTIKEYKEVRKELDLILSVPGTSITDMSKDISQKTGHSFEQALRFDSYIAVDEDSDGTVDFIVAGERTVVLAARPGFPKKNVIFYSPDKSNQYLEARAQGKLFVGPSVKPLDARTGHLAERARELEDMIAYRLEKQAYDNEWSPWRARPKK